MAEHQLDALIAPTGGPPSLIDLVNGDPGGGGSFSSPAAVAGYPHVTVPLGYVVGLPVGLSFLGRPWSEGTLIKCAYAFEQATEGREGALARLELEERARVRHRRRHLLTVADDTGIPEQLRDLAAIVACHALGVEAVEHLEKAGPLVQDHAPRQPGLEAVEHELA